MISHLEGRDKALEPFGWTGRRAEWIALACLHGGVFTRAQWTDFLGCHWSIHTCRGEGGCLRGARDRPRDPAPAGLPGSGREHPPLLSASSAGRAGEAGAQTGGPGADGPHRHMADVPPRGDAIPVVGLRLMTVLECA